MKRLFTCLFLLFCGRAALAEDVIVFNNGDTLTGTILSYSETSVHLKTDAFGSVNLPLNNIKEIHSEGDVRMELAEAALPVAALNDVEPLTPERKIPKWSGQTGLSLAMRESNSIGLNSNGTVYENNDKFETYRVYGDIKWEYEKNELKWNWDYRYGRSDVKKYDDFFNVTQKYRYDVTETYYTEVKSMYQYDYRRSMDHEYLQSAEVGVKWLDTPSFELTTSGGCAYHEYERLENTYSGGSAKLILDQSFRWKMLNTLTLFEKYTHLGDLEEYQLFFSGGLENKLVKDVFVRFEYQLKKDTQLDYNGKGYYDRSLLTSLLYKF